MAITLPAAVNLHRIKATNDANYRGDIGTPSGTSSTKPAGNLPITETAMNYQNPAGLSGVSFNFPTAFNSSTDTKVFVWAWQFNAPNRIQSDATTNNGIVTRIYTGAGDNYRQFIIGGNNTPAASSQGGPLPIVIDPQGASYSSEVGTWDDTNITGYGFANTYFQLSGDTSTQAFFVRVFLFDTVKDGDLPTFTGVSDFDDIITTVLGTDYTTKIHTFVSKAGSTYTLLCPWQIGDNGTTTTTFNDNGATVLSPANNDSSDPRFQLSNQAMRVYLSLGVSDSVTLSGTYVWGTAASWDFNQSSGTVDITGATFNGMGEFVCGSAVSGAATFNLDASTVVVINGADLDGSIINGDLNVQGSSVATLTDISITGALDFDTAGTYTLDSCSVGEITNSSGGSVTIINSGSTITTNTGPNITINIAGLTLSVTSLTSSNILLLDNTGTQIDYQTNQSGTYQYTLPNGSSGTWTLVIDRAGYASSVNTFTSDGVDKSFNGVLTQLTQPSGAAMYLGSSSALLSVVPNPDGSRMNVRIGNGTVTAQQILDECEDALATNDGIKYLSNGGGRVEFAALPTGTFLFMKSNVRLIRDNVGDSSATVEAFVTSTDGVVLDNTNGDVQFVTVTRAQQLIEYDHAIYIDAANGVNASVYPFGTESNPVNSWSNAKVLADFYGFRHIYFKGSLTLDADAENYIFFGGGLNDVLNTSTYSVAGSTFKEMDMLGSGTGARACETVNLLNGITNLEGTFTLCAFNEQLSVAANADIIFSRCISGLSGTAAPQITLNTNTQVSIRDYDGGLVLSGSTAGCNTTADFTSGKCTLDNTNTGGVISVRGITSTAFTDNSAGATIDSTGVHEQPSEALTDYSADTKTNIKPSVSI